MVGNEDKVMLNVRIPQSLKNDLERVALERKHRGGKRVTSTDVVIEALRAVVQAHDHPDQDVNPMSAEDRAQYVAEQGQYGGRQSQGEHEAL